VGEGTTISVNHLMLGTDGCVPVGSEAGAADVDDAVTTVGVVELLLGGSLLPTRERSLAIMSLIIATRSSELIVAGALVYNIRSGNHSCGDTLPTLTASLQPYMLQSRLTIAP
jgi:hypothetical protein